MTRAHIKVLSLPYNQSRQTIKIPPVFNRDGFYYDRLRRLAWYEWKGRAYLGRVEDFLFSLRINDAEQQEFPADAKQIMKTLRLYGLLDNQLAERYYWWTVAMDCRNVRREAKKHCMTSLKEFKNAQPTT